METETIVMDTMGSAERQEPTRDMQRIYVAGEAILINPPELLASELDTMEQTANTQISRAMRIKDIVSLERARRSGLSTSA